MKENRCYVRLYFETETDELFNDFIDKITNFVRQYDGRDEEFLSSVITSFKGKVYDDPFEKEFN